MLATEESNKLNCVKDKRERVRDREEQRGWMGERKEGGEALHSKLAALSPAHVTGTHTCRESQPLPVPGRLCLNSVLTKTPYRAHTCQSSL